MCSTLFATRDVNDTVQVYWFEEGLLQKSTKKTAHKVSKILRALLFAEMFFCESVQPQLDVRTVCSACALFTQLHYFVYEYNTSQLERFPFN